MTAPDQGSVVFGAAHRPALVAGTYEVRVAQQVAAGGQGETFSARARLHVRGPRTVLEPSAVESRFPTATAGTQDAGVLPHVVLTRSTLPWERSAIAGTTDGPPWLALLLLTEPELAGEGTWPAVVEAQVPISALRPPTTIPEWPGLVAEEGEIDDATVRVVDVPRGLLDEVLPPTSWLGHLAHVRERFVGSLPHEDVAADLDRGALPDALAALLREEGHQAGAVQVEVPGEEWRVGDSVRVERRADTVAVTVEARAVVLGGRATTAGDRYRAYLVSVADRYTATGLDSGAAADTPVRLVVLDGWDFAVDATAGRLEALLGDLHLAHGLPLPTDGLHGDGVPLLRAGYALLSHRLRTGGTVRSWYRGPLVADPQDVVVPGRDPDEVADVADDLLVADTATGILFASHAAAWELGRTLTVADPAVGLDLLGWRSAYRRHHHRTSAAPRPIAGPSGSPPPVPTGVAAWLRRLLLLDGVPFGYLVPDPAMLPPESLRTFGLDPGWLHQLLAGALSVGRLPGTAPGPEREPLAAAIAAARIAVAGGSPEAPNPVSGCLLRSEVVSSRPGLLVDAWADPWATVRCPVLRRVRPADGVLMVLFAGEPVRIDLHPDPEALHHGLVRTRGGWATPRDGDGRPGGAPVVLDGRDVLARAASPPAADLTPERFALSLISGVPRLEVGRT